MWLWGSKSAGLQIPSNDLLRVSSDDSSTRKNSTNALRVNVMKWDGHKAASGAKLVACWQRESRRLLDKYRAGRDTDGTCPLNLALPDADNRPSG